MRILVRTSKFAIWARRFGSVALPLAVIPVLLHRERLVTSETFAVLASVALTCAAMAVVLAVIAFGRLWVTGDQGWNRALIGLLLGLVCLSPPAYLGWQATRQPMITDFSTDPRNPPALLAGAALVPLEAAAEQAAARAYPNVRTRTYPVDAARTFGLVVQLAAANGWEIRFRRAPQGLLGEGQINALAMRFLGWRDEVAIRVVGTPAGAIVDMRSRTQDGGRDLGGNGPRIEQFLLGLDDAVTRLLRDSPDTPAAEEAEETPRGP